MREYYNDLMKKVTADEVLRYYNAIGSIFSSLSDDCDSRTRLVANKYQDNSMVCLKVLEANVIDACLKDGVEEITIPYTIDLENCMVRIYLVEEEKIDVLLNDNIEVFSVPALFKENKDLKIALVNKDVFSMEKLHNNFEDRKMVVRLYKEI